MCVCVCVLVLSWWPTSARQWKLWSENPTQVMLSQCPTQERGTLGFKMWTLRHAPAPDTEVWETCRNPASACLVSINRSRNDTTFYPSPFIKTENYFNIPWYMMIVTSVSLVRLVGMLHLKHTLIGLMRALQLKLFWVTVHLVGSVQSMVGSEYACTSCERWKVSLGDTAF